jgi:hypothetical protein
MTAPTEMVPASYASAGTVLSSPTDMRSVPTGVIPEPATKQHVPLEAVLQMLNSGAITEDDALSMLSPESIAQLEQMVQSDTL